MSQIHLYDNFLEEEKFKEIQDTLLGRFFPWFYADRVNYMEYTSEWEYQFTHVFYADNLPNSEHFDLLIPYIDKLQPKSLIRIKANLLTRSEKTIEHGYHSNQSFDCKTAIAYINTNNGYTVFEDGQKVMSKENRLIMFDNSVKHSGSTCSDQKTWVIINFNYF